MALFNDLNPDDLNQETTEIESCCMNCFRNGTTRLLLTKIPFYKEIILMSFCCEHCGFENNDIQSGGKIADKGCKIILNVQSTSDLNRRCIKSDHTSIKLVELDLEVPAQSQKGEITTVEGIIDRSIRGLEQDQTVRRIDHPEIAEKIDKFIKDLERLKLVNTPFTIEFEDISGNLFIENPYAPNIDKNCLTTKFQRSSEQDKLLGIYSSEIIAEGVSEKKTGTNKCSFLQPISENDWSIEELCGEVHQFKTKCSGCGVECDTNMKLTNIPHFKEVIIMATVCDECGHRTNEVKCGGGIEEKGIRYEVALKGPNDMSRDILKSDTCRVFIPELDCEIGSSALVGRFTTVEGILVGIKEQLADQCSIFFNDSADQELKEKMDSFFKKIDNIINGITSATLVLDDPAGNSYVQSLNDDERSSEPDAGLKVIKYKRNHEQNEELGLNDMRTENYL